MPYGTVYRNVINWRAGIKQILIFTLLLSVECLSCDTETTSSKSAFLVDIKASTLSEGQTCVKFLLESLNPSNNRYVNSVSLNIKNKKNQSIAIISPEPYRQKTGQILYSACFSNGYVENTVIQIFSEAKSSITLDNGISHSESSSFCLEAEYVEIGKAIEAYKKGN
jgi:hypothetical protein